MRWFRKDLTYWTAQFPLIAVNLDYVMSASQCHIGRIGGSDRARQNGVGRLGVIPER
jgi:hypothetical protein